MKYLSKLAVPSRLFVRSSSASVVKRDQALRAAVKAVGIESLENRRLLAVITVNQTYNEDARDGNLTLREAINIVDGTDAYASLTSQEQAQIDLTQPLGTNDTIKFNIHGTGLQTIYPETALPAITKPVTIDGYSQPGSSAATSTAAATFGVALDGVYAGAAAGLTVEATNVTIDGLMIYRFAQDTTNYTAGTGAGIFLTVGSGSDSIWGNYLGTDGTRSLGNADGIDIENPSSNNTIGGTTADKRNVISGNSDTGIEMTYNFQTEQASGNVVEGNYIGTDAAGTSDIPNNVGVAISRSYNNTIGGVTPGARNIISGNTTDGVDISYDGNTVEGNYIGLDVTGAANLGNDGDGISLYHTYDVVTISGNVISGNGSNSAPAGSNPAGYGIIAQDTPAPTVTNNYIGTNAAGTAAIGNKLDGIFFNDIYGGAIGGTDANTGNVISGNGGNGINLTNGYDDITVQGNYVGTDVTGAKAIANGGSGIFVSLVGDGLVIGGTIAAARNIISGNSAFGIDLNDSSGVVVEGNYIGVAVDGKTALGDGNAGVYLEMGAQGNTIGGTTAGARNVISGIGGAEVIISGQHIDYSGGAGQPTLSNSNIVEGNYIGTDSTGAKRVIGTPPPIASYEPFNGDGIFLDGGTFNNTIGGLTAGAQNVIAGNVANGIHLYSAGAGNTIEGNYIGVDATGSAALGNGVAGITLLTSGSTLIGGTTAAARNVISGNGTASKPTDSAGIDVLNGSNNIIQGNAIGTDASGTINLGNFGDGVVFEVASQNNTVGGNLTGAANIIAYNAGAGVVVSDKFRDNGSSGGPSTGNTIRRNSIFGNTGLGIDLGDDGVTANDPQDVDTFGGNNLQNFPVLVTATSNGSSVTVGGTFNSVPSTNFTLDFYANDTVDVNGFGQGKVYLGSVGVVTDASGNATFSSTFNVAIGSNKYITATATNMSTAPYGDTSEFSQAVEATAGSTGTGGGGGGGTTPVPPSLAINDVKQNEGNSGTTAYTFTITRSGDLSGATTVGYTTADVTATQGSDYTSASGTVTFNAGQATATVTVLVNGDTAVEPDETFNVNLTNPTNATISKAQGVGTIVNDDVTPPPSVAINDVSQKEGNSGTTAFTFTLTRSGDLSSSSIVSISTADGTATAGSDYAAQSGTLVAFAAGQSTATVTINVNGDTTVESDETFAVNVTSISNATISDGQGIGTIQNDDVALPPPSVAINDVSQKEGNSGTTAFTFTLTRSGDLSAASTVSVSTANGTATAGSDYTALNNQLVTFAIGQSTATVTVNVAGDTTVEADETFNVNVTAVTNATISDGQGVGTIQNDDVAPVLPSVSINDVKQNEGNSGTTAFTFTLTRTGDLSKTSTVSISTADGTATAGSDYTALKNVQVTFAAGKATATVTVYVTGDKTYEADETFNVNVTAVTNAAISDGQGVGTIVNDDAAPAATGVLSGYAFNDGNANGVYDKGDSVASGKTIFLDTNNNGVLDAGEKSVVTDQYGDFSFTGLAAGTYHVRRVFPNGFTSSTPPIDLTITAGQKVTTLAIGSKTVPAAKTGTISGFTFNDTNKDGVYESSDTKVSGRTVFLDTNNNGKLDAGEQSTVTGSGGAFSFTALAAGTYHVREVLPSGFAFSTKLIDLVLADGQTASGLTIGTKTA